MEKIQKVNNWVAETLRWDPNYASALDYIEQVSALITH